MRIGLLLVGAAALAGCAPTAPPMARSPDAAARLNQLLAGRVAGPPQNCISRFGANDMIVVDDNTILFKSGGTYYRNDFRGEGCSHLGRPGYALVTKSFGGTQLCSGEISTVRDTTNGIIVGSCAFGPFIPYRAP